VSRDDARPRLVISYPMAVPYPAEASLGGCSLWERRQVKARPLPVPNWQEREFMSRE
jgi:hypothetical protein